MLFRLYFLASRCNPPEFTTGGFKVARLGTQRTQAAVRTDSEETSSVRQLILLESGEEQKLLKPLGYVRTMG